MKAILLAAGVGKRMGLGAPPKCLLALGGKSILKRTFESLRAIGIPEVVLVVGYESQKVKAEALSSAPGLKLEFIENPRYTEGAILSLWAARDHFNDDLLIMDTDVLFPTVAMERLVRSAHPNGLLVDTQTQDTGEEQIVMGSGTRVLCITKRPSQDLKTTLTVFGESVGFLKLSRQAALILRKLLEEKVASGIVTIEHEQVYPQLFQEVNVGLERMDGLAWIEVDTPEDLKRARQEILPRWEGPQCLNRVMARWFFPWIVRLAITPNQWTFFSLFIGLAAVACIRTGDDGLGLLGALLFQIFYLIDNWDGEVARAKGLSSKWGGWFDVAVDAIIQVSLALALSQGLLRMGHPSYVALLGQVAAAGLALDFGVTSWAKIKGFGPAIYGDPSRGRAVLSDSKFKRFLRTNLTNENFSLLVVGVLILDGRLPFLWALAVGSQLFWITFLWKSRHRLTA